MASTERVPPRAASDRRAPPPQTVTRTTRAFVAGLAGTACVMALSAAVHLASPRVPFLPVAIAQVLVGTTSGGVDSFFIGRLGHWAARLAIAGTCLAYFLAGGALGRLIESLGGARGGPPAAGALSLLPLWVVSVALYPTAPQFIARPAFAMVALGMYVLGGACGGLADAHMRASRPGGTADPSRRYFLASVAVAGVAAAAGALDVRHLLRPAPDPALAPLHLTEVRPAPAPPQQPGDRAFATIPHITPEITPTSRFYVVNEEFVSPRVDATSWRLSMGGEVARPFHLTYAGLQGLPAVERYQTLECISNEVGGGYISTAKFTGIPVRELLDRAGIRPGAVEVVFRAVSGYADSIPVGVAMDPTTLVAFGIADHELPIEHGFPARLLAVGNYGMKNPKWLTAIEVVNQPYRGFWERRGWSKEAKVRTNSRIDVPSPGARVGDVRTIAGIAFAGDRGISKVEVSLDGGSTWHAATLKTALSPYTWRLWRFDPDPNDLRPGRTVVVRAYDGSGAVQASRSADPFPQGSAGYHAIDLRS
jgi:DMSO/TMAO reductase YedYZ molybdopterin-dependent catalytic subunit